MIRISARKKSRIPKMFRIWLKQESERIRNSVANLTQGCGMDPHHFNADPDPAFHFNADADQAPIQSNGNL
jgi:hypothetical protein